MYQTARGYVGDSTTASGLSGYDKSRKQDHSADARNDMHIANMNEAFHNSLQTNQMMGMTGGLKVQDLIRMGKQDAQHMQNTGGINAQDYLNRYKTDQSPNYSSYNNTGRT